MYTEVWTHISTSLAWTIYNQVFREGADPSRSLDPRTMSCQQMLMASSILLFIIAISFSWVSDILLPLSVYVLVWINLDFLSLRLHPFPSLSDFAPFVLFFQGEVGAASVDFLESTPGSYLRVTTSDQIQVLLYSHSSLEIFLYV